MNQVLLGAALPFVIGTVIYLARRCRATLGMLVVVPVIMFLSSVWAILPDVPRVLGMQELYTRLSQDPRCDIFFWHYTIDLQENDSRWFAAGFVLMLVLVMFVALRELWLREREGPSNG